MMNVGRDFLYAHTYQYVLAHVTLKKAIELTEEPLPVHNESSVKLNTSIYLRVPSVYI
jgi:hypothetical protein